MFEALAPMSLVVVSARNISCKAFSCIRGLLIDPLKNRTNSAIGQEQRGFALLAQAAGSQELGKLG